MIEARNEALDADLEAEPATEVREQLLRERRYWRSRLATAQLAPAPAGDTVAIGTRVTIDQAGRSRVLDIVGHDESDPDAGRIAFGAPLARTLIGGRAGEEIETPPGPITIVSIQVLADT